MLFLAFVFLLELILDFPTPARAYTDPNIGNLIFQILFPVITVVTTGYLICKRYIKRKISALLDHFRERNSKNLQ